MHSPDRQFEQECGQQHHQCPNQREVLEGILKFASGRIEQASSLYLARGTTASMKCLNVCKENSLRHVFGLALDGGLVAELAGGRSDAALVSLVYRNIVGSEPSVADTVALAQYFEAQGGPYSQLDFLVVAAELPLNQGHVDLVGYATSGVVYSL